MSNNHSCQDVISVPVCGCRIRAGSLCMMICMWAGMFYLNIQFCGDCGFIKYIFLPFLFWLWGSFSTHGALQPNWHSLECVPVLSFCQHHHCMELSQARHLTDKQMGVVNFSNLAPSHCPLYVQRRGSMPIHTYTEDERAHLVSWTASSLSCSLQLSLGITGTFWDRHWMIKEAISKKVNCMIGFPFDAKW